MAIQQQPVVPAAFSGDALDLARSQRLAQLLSNQQMPEGQMISGRFVAPSWTQQLAGLVNAGTGAYFANKSEKQQQALAEKLRRGETEAIADFMKIRQGTPARPAPAGYELGDTGTPAIPPNPLMANANLYADPRAPQRLRDLAFTKMMADPEAFTLPEGSVRYEKSADGTIKQVAAGGEKQSPEYRNYLIAKDDPINPFKGGFTDYQTMIKKAGATSINMPSGEERKAGFMSTILDRNILQMQNALGVDPTAVKPNVPASIVEAITGPTLLSRGMKPAQRQIVEDSQLDVLDAALTLRTGAAYTREQLNAMRDTYFPVLLDKPAAIAEKKQRLESLLDGAYIAAGRATPPRVSAPPPAPPALPPAKAGRFPPPPAGVPQNVWNVMTPQEQALWPKK
jgi:hypothetical protein